MLPRLARGTLARGGARAGACAPLCLLGARRARAAHTGAAQGRLAPELARGTMACVGEHWALSPAVGLALAQDAGLWSNLRASTEQHDDGLSRLLRALFFAPCHEAPIRRTRNASLPAAHLSPELLGHIAGVGMLTDAPPEAIHARLRALGISPLAKRTGVSIARFVGLALEFRAAAAACGHARELGLLACPGHALASTFAWELCESREELLRYLLALAEYAPAALAESGKLARCADARAAWLRAPAYSAAELADEGALADAARVLLGAREWATLDPVERLRLAAAYELLAAASASTGEADGPAAVPQARYGFRGQPDRADCVEVVLRAIIDWLVWSPTRGGFDLGLLPPSALPAVRAYWLELSQDASAPARWGEPRLREKQLGQRWFDICAELRPCAFLAGAPERGGVYELAPTLANVCGALTILLGVRLDSIRALEQLPARVAAPMAALSVHVDRTWADREGFTLRLGHRQLSVVLKEISNHAFLAHNKVKREHMASAARVYAAGWREGRVAAGPAWTLASRLLPCLTLVDGDDATAERDSTAAARGSAAVGRGSAAAARLAVLSCRLLDADVVAAALRCELGALARADEGEPSAFGRAGLLPLLAAAAGQHASLSGSHAAATMRSASGLARALHELPAAHAPAVRRAVAAAPPLAALVAIQAGDGALLAAACARLSLADLSRLLWPALMIRRSARAAHDGAPGASAARTPAERQLAAAQQAASGRWALAAVVCATAARRVATLCARQAAQLRASSAQGAVGEAPAPSAVDESPGGLASGELSAVAAGRK
jgi:hypothetical protein